MRWPSVALHRWAQGPTATRYYTATKADALLLIEACLCGRLPFWMQDPERSEPILRSGNFFVFPLDHTSDRLDDSQTWTTAGADGAFEILRSDGPIGLVKKEIRITMGGIQYHVISYYNPWHTVTGVLKSPLCSGDFEDVKLREKWPIDEGTYYLSPTEIYRCSMEDSLGEVEKRLLATRDMGVQHTDFARNTLFLIMKWTKESDHPALLQRCPGLLLPIIPSNEGDWLELSQWTVFTGMRPSQLAFQTQILLNRLLCVSTGTDKILSGGTEPFLEFTPLQNVCLYVHAFGIRHNPLGAFCPLDDAKIACSLSKVGILPEWSEGQIKKWDDMLRCCLPIDCPGNSVEFPRSFTAMLAAMRAEDQEAVHIGIELICEQYPTLEKPEHRYAVLLHEFYHSSSDENTEILRCWSKTKEGKDTQLQLLQTFQTPLEPIELALIITDMLALWSLNDQAEEDYLFEEGDGETCFLDGTHEDRPSELLPGLQALQQFLSDPLSFQRDYALLRNIIESFNDAVETLPAQEAHPLKVFLRKTSAFDLLTPLDKEMSTYILVRFGGNKAHSQALNDPRLEYLIEGWPCPNDLVENWMEDVHLY